MEVNCRLPAFRRTRTTPLSYERTMPKKLASREQKFPTECFPSPRQPRAIEELRRWTSAEALGDVTVAPDCASRILATETGDDDQAVDHKLPSPEEQLQAIALK